MSFDFTLLPARTTDTIQELDMVTLTVAVRTDEGETIPKGTLGTVVAIWAGGEAYEVEFVEGFEGLATVPAAQIASHSRYTA